jgi:hypothetical protein
MRNLYLIFFLLLFNFSVSAQRIIHVGDRLPSFYDKLDRTESKFNENAEGWQLLDASGNNPQALELKSHGEDLTLPGEHKLTYLSGKMTLANAWYYWVAPEKYWGNWMFSSYRLELWFSLNQSVAGTNNAYADVIISNGNSSIYYRLADKPAPPFRAYAIVLDETGGWRTSAEATSPLATKDQISRVLSNVTSLRIRGKYNNTANLVAGIENVILFKWPQSDRPLITNVTPGAGTPLTSVTITGSQFGNAIDKNEVYFGGVKGRITHATPTQLAVQVPVGAQFGPITITNLATGYSTATLSHFNPLYDNEGDAGGKIIPASLDHKVDFPLANKAKDISMGDLDCDGKNDLVVTEGGISVFRNLGVTGDITTASFASKFSLPYGNAEHILADLDGDGRLDIAAIHNQQRSEVAVYRNISSAGTLAFETALLFPALNYSSHGLHAADIDGDGLLDLLATHSNAGVSPYLYILQNTSGSGFIDFSWGKSFTAPGFSAASELTTADLDKDGKPEVLVVSGFNQSIHVFPNRSLAGNMRLEAPFVIDSEGSVYGLACADLEGDGRIDIIWKGSTPKDIIIRQNNYSSGNLSAADFSKEIILSSALLHYGGIAIADINADRKPDIIAGDDGDQGIFQHIGAPGSLTEDSFLEGVIYEGGNSIYPLNPVIGDLDGDAKPDVVLAFTNAAKISVYRNECFPAPRIVTAGSRANANADLSIKGEKLKVAGQAPLVLVGGSEASILSSNVNETVVKTPPVAAYQPIALTRHGLSAFSVIPFSLTFNATASLNSSTFVQRAEFALTNTDGNIAITDFNHDNFPDVVVTDIINGAKVKVFRNTISMPGNPVGQSGFVLQETLDAAGKHIGISDIDGDGGQDILVQGNAYRNSSNSTEISFNLKVSTPLSKTGSLKTRLDFNRDGKMDMAATSAGNSIIIAENQSKTGPFVASADFGTWATPFPLVLPGGNVAGIDGGDFDLDGFDDLVYGVYSLNKVHVVKNRGLPGKLSAQSFEAPLVLDVLAKPLAIQTGDFDQDGKLDIVTVNQEAGSFSIFRNTTAPSGPISFERSDFTIAANPVDLALADFNGDGKVDLAVIHQTTTSTGLFSIIPNTSTTTISFGTPIAYNLPNVPVGIAAADINRDKRPDIILTREKNLGPGNTEAVLAILKTQLP